MGMYTGINQWAFPPDWSVEQVLALAASIGFESVELCVDEAGALPLDAPEARLKEIRDFAAKQGLRLSSVGCGLGWKYPLSAAEPEARKQALAVVEQALRVTAGLGADALLVVPGAVTPTLAYDVALENALEAVREAAVFAERHQVKIGIENVWNRFLLSPVEMRDFIDHCESPWVGAYFDVGNVLAFGYPEQWIRILGDRICKIHLKDFRTATGSLDGFVMLMEGDVDWPRVMRSLRAIGYEGPLTAEYGAYAHGLEPMLRHVLSSEQALLAMPG